MLSSSSTSLSKRLNLWGAYDRNPFKHYHPRRMILHDTREHLHFPDASTVSYHNQDMCTIYEWNTFKLHHYCDFCCVLGSVSHILKAYEVPRYQLLETFSVFLYKYYVAYPSNVCGDASRCSCLRDGERLWLRGLSYFEALPCLWLSVTSILQKNAYIINIFHTHLMYVVMLHVHT